MSQHTVETVTPVLHRRSVIDATSVSMYNSKHGNVGPASMSWQRSYQCTTCLREYLAQDVMMVDGRPFCIPFKHYEDPLHDKNIKEQSR